MLDLPDPAGISGHGNSIEYEANSQGRSSKSLGKTGGQGAAPQTQVAVERMMPRQQENEEIPIHNTDHRSNHSATYHKKSYSHNQYQYDMFNDVSKQNPG